LLKMVLKADFFINLSWLVLYDQMMICERLLGVEYDVYHKVLYLLLYLVYEKVYGIVELYCVVDVDVCWYMMTTLNWIVICWMFGHEFLIMQLLMN
jgi:hypothetical protein